MRAYPPALKVEVSSRRTSHPHDGSFTVLSSSMTFGLSLDCDSTDLWNEKQDWFIYSLSEESRHESFVSVKYSEELCYLCGCRSMRRAFCVFVPLFWMKGGLGSGVWGVACLSLRCCSRRHIAMSIVCVSHSGYFPPSPEWRGSSPTPCSSTASRLLDFTGGQNSPFQTLDTYGFIR